MTDSTDSATQNMIFQDDSKDTKEDSFSCGSGDGKLEKTRENAKSPEPIAFTELFRYSTKFELLIDFIGLIAAAGAGAARPLMTVFFGNLTQDFVNFHALLEYARRGNRIAEAMLPEAASVFRHNATKNATYLVYIGVAILVCTYAYMYIWVYTGEANAKRIREKYLEAVLRQDITFFDNVGAGEIAVRIETNTHLVQQAISEKVPILVNHLAVFFIGFILAYVPSWRLALAMTAALPCMAITSGIQEKFMSKYMQLSLEHVAQGASIAEEVFSAIRTTHAFGSQRVLAELYDDRITHSLNVELKSTLIYGSCLSIFFFIANSLFALAFSFGTTLINHHQAEAGQVIKAFLALLIGSSSLGSLVPEIQAIVNGRGAAVKLYETISRIPDIDSADPGGKKLDQVKGEVTLEGIHFSYPSRPSVEVVKGVDITFAAGKTTALIGASGSGKSTIISLLERFYDPTAGIIKLDGHELKGLNLKWLRNQIGLVSQEPILFATTIRKNVLYGLTGSKYEYATKEEKDALMKEACFRANAHGFISKLPEGYDTMVGGRGFLLSGGQKQRVAIARAIISDPRVLLLDEATSALDTQSEGIVQDALDKAAAGRTTILIAHRLSTIKDSDIIHVMGDGLIIESGTHDELLAQHGAYSRLIQAQKLYEGKDSTAEMGARTDDIQEIDLAQIPLDGANTRQSLTSEILAQKRKTLEVSRKLSIEDDYGLFYLFKRMGCLVRDQWLKYFLASISACFFGMAYPAMGVVFARGIEGFASIDLEQRRHEGDRNSLWLFVIAIVSAITSGLAASLLSIAASNLTARLRVLSFKAVVRQDIEFFDQDKNSTGALTARLNDNPQKVNGLAGVTLGAIVQSIATVIGGSVLGLVYVWKLALVGIAAMPLLLSTGYIRLRVVVLKGQSDKKAHNDSAQLACEAAASIKTVASLTREYDCLRLYSESLVEPLRRSNKSAVWSNLLYAFSQAAMYFVMAPIFWWGAGLTSRLEASMFDVFIALMSTTFSAIQAGSVFSFVPDMSSAKSAGSNILRLLDSIPEIDAESTEGRAVYSKAIQGHIKLENVHFCYPTRPGIRVLCNLSLDVEPGTYVAVVGASGSGKSTIIQLIERFYDTLAGDIYIDGQKITELNVQEYRKNLALVSQEPLLFAGTIRFNILIGATKLIEEVTQEEIETACREANILEFIKGLPSGFDTEVGDKGSQLSGGQKQRIAIARALLRNPKVLLLDEATSALDSQSEGIVQTALDRAAKGRTTIAVAHRLSTIQNADKIYFIKEGCVSESGTHEQLIAIRGDYFEYVQLQAVSGYTRKRVVII